MKASYDIVVSGRVQGVGFRYFTQRMAQQYNLAGYVRNQQNGSVFIHIEGNSNQIMEFIAACRKGPVSADVAHLEIKDSSFLDIKSFQINS